MEEQKPQLPPQVIDEIRSMTQDELKETKTRCSSLTEVAAAFDVTLYRVLLWRKECPALRAENKPYDLAIVTLHLLMHKIVHLGELPRQPIIALCMHLIQSAPGAGLVNRLYSRAINLYADELNKAKSSWVPGFISGKTTDDVSLTKSITQAAQLSKCRPLDSSESALVSIASPKSAALFVDRVWTLDPTIPSEIEFVTGTSQELAVRGLLDQFVESAAVARFGNSFMDEVETNNDDEWDAIEAFFDSAEREIALTEELWAPKFEELVMGPIRQVYARDVCPFMSSSNSLNLIHEPGQYQAVYVAVENLGIIDESRLTWEQVLEIRKDADSQMKLKRMMHWVDDRLAGKSLSFIQDELEIRLHDYRDALSKHGVERRSGVFGQLLSARTWMSIFAASTTTSLAFKAGNFNEVAAATAFAGLSVLGGNLVHEYRSIKRKQQQSSTVSEIAYLSEVGRGH